MALVSDTNGTVSKRDTSSSFLSTDGAIFGLILDEGDTRATWHETDFSKAGEAAEDGCKLIDTVIVGELPNEQDLVRWEVFIRNDTGTGTTSTLEPGTTRCLDALSRLFWFWCPRCWAFEVPGSFRSLEGLLALCRQLANLPL